jgi:hypothetical protein
LPTLIHHPLSESNYVILEPTRRFESSRWRKAILLILVLSLAAICLFFLGPEAYSQARLPGSDASDKLEMAGTLLKLIDVGLFKWGARIFSGLCIMSSAWALKEQRFGIAIICIVGAIIFGTATTWVKNIFEIGGGDSVFGLVPFLLIPTSKRLALRRLTCEETPYA